MQGRFCAIRRHTIFSFLVALTLAPAIAEAQRAEGSFERTLAVTGPAEIEVMTGSGRIEVRSGPAGHIEVSARIRAADGRGWIGRGRLTPEERVRRIEANPPIEQTGSIVRIGRIDDEDLRNGVSIAYTLTVPADSSLRSRSGSGSQNIEGVGGAVDASSGSGSLTLKNVGSGLRVSTGSGSIVADGVGGSFHAKAGSGSIRATGVNGAISVKTGSGGIDVSQAGGGDVEASSGSGPLQLRGVRGAVRASTASGRLEVEGDPTGDWRLSAASGSVRVRLPEHKGVEVDASSGSGNINVGFPVTVSGTIGRKSVRGSARGGGPLLHVRTASGGIEIR
jgi:hypothetical protein